METSITPAKIRLYGYGQAQAAIEIDRWLIDLDSAPLKN